ncbi:zinc finger protein 28 homolog [Microplitis demolitor]|uniref:zinc finger protein 28 homolog n=1 Tax=Microplitis demolitor TaxID=69319 RepID=UPI0004CDA27F|nr:zinc finger protein 28 homolog [Microplitis demolitor]
MMSEDMTVDTSYLTYEINGSQFVFQTSPSTLVDVGSLDVNNKDVNVNFISKNQLNDVNHVDNHDGDDLEPVINSNDGEEESIPIVCVDGVIYALQDGQLQELDLSRLQSNGNIDDQVFMVPKADNQSIDFKEEPEINLDNYSLHDGINVDVNNRSVEDDFKLDREYGDDTLNANDFVEVVAAFKCKICPFTTQDRGQLLKHFQTVHANPASLKVEEEPGKTDDVKLVYMCGECSNCFPSMENCREHMIKDHQLTDGAVDTEHESAKQEIKSFDDLLSKKVNGKVSRQVNNKVNKITTSTDDEYTNNKKKLEIKERNVKCNYRGCIHKFSTEELMQKHAVCHIESQNPNVFKCNVCTDLMFAKWRTCCMHLWKKHSIDIDLLCCSICKNYKSVSSVKLLTHMRVHSENRDYECPDCGKCFKQSSQLRNHRVMHLDRKSVEVPRWYTSKTCEMCGKTYADSKCLKNHMQAVHSKLRPYVCTVCGHSSARKAMLQMHLRQHTGDKPFNCDKCPFKTGDHNSLRRHIMRHTGVRPYKCPHCSYSAIQSSAYKNHLRAKHPKLSGLFTCEICPFKTVKKESYMEHVGNHEKGIIKTTNQKNDANNVEVFPGNMAAAQLIYSCLGAFSKEEKEIEASLMSSSTSADGTSQTITIQIPSTHLENTLPIGDNAIKNNISINNNINNGNSTIEQEDDETMHCFLKIPHEEEENIDTGGITIPADPEDIEPTILNVES